MQGLFAPVAPWTARASDGNDHVFAACVTSGPRRDARIGLFGVPYDGAVLGRPGARDGPTAIRQELALLKPATFAGRTSDACWNAADFGNARTSRGSVLAAHDIIHGAATAITSMRIFPVALGGDHSCTYPLVRAHCTAGRRVGVINLDAHLDIRDVHGEPSSGTPFGRLIEDGLVRGENYVAIGVRDFATSTHYLEKARKTGLTAITSDDVDRRGVPTVVEEALARAGAGTDGIYLSVDLDALDESAAPGVSAATPGGLTTRELYGLIAGIARSGALVGADFMEVAPILDVGNRTARAAAYGVMHLLANLPEA